MKVMAEQVAGGAVVDGLYWVPTNNCISRRVKWVKTVLVTPSAVIVWSEKEEEYNPGEVGNFLVLGGSDLGDGVHTVEDRDWEWEESAGGEGILSYMLRTVFPGKS